MHPIYFFRAPSAMGMPGLSRRSFVLVGTSGLAIIAFCALSACDIGPPPGALDVGQPEGWADQLAMNIPVDLDPAPDVLEIELEARVTDMEIIPGKTTPVWTYN